MSDLVLAGGTVVTAEGSFRADVAVTGETIEAIGTDVPRDGAEVVDVSGARVMPGFIDGHTHMDMPFGGTVTADDWDTGTAAALAGGTTTIVDFSLQDPERTLADAVETWHGKADEKAHIDYGFHVAITNLTEDVKKEIPSLPALGVATIKIFMAYKGTPLYTEDQDLFEAMQIAREAGVLVLVHAENGDVIASLQAQALAAGNTEPRFHALTRPEEVEAEATNRAIRLAEVADAPLLVVHVSCAKALEEVRRAHARGRPVYAETCPQYLVFSYDELAQDGFEGAKYVLSPPLRDRATSRRCGTACRRRTCTSSAPTTARSTTPKQKELGRDDFTLIPNGAPGAEERSAVLWTHGVREGRVSENLMVAVLSTNQAKVHGMAGKKGVLAPGADADIVVWDPDLTITATQSNRHGNVDYTPYEGMTFTGGPASVYVRGKLAYRDGEVVAPAGSGKFVRRSFSQPAPGPAVR